MPQLSREEIEEIAATYKDRTYVVPSHPWVQEDGVYEEEKPYLRWFIWKQFAYSVVSKLWIEHPEESKRLKGWQTAPWGTFPRLPAKPPKKTS